jgi:methionyl-tRNA formyltransferase
MRIVFFGTGPFAVPALRALHAAGHEIVVVVSQPDRPAGRGRVIVPTPVHAAAGALGLPHAQAADVATLPPGLLDRAELGVVADFGQKLGPALLAALPRGCINVHGSLLPRYRGAAPYQWAILNGEPRTGVTVFQLDPRWDAGAIWSQREIEIGPTQTADELRDRLADVGAALLVETIPQIQSGQIQPRPQDPAQASRAPKLTKADAALDWSQPAVRIVRRIHGLWSWPAAACTFASRAGRRERLQLARARVADARAVPTLELPPGAFAPDLTVQSGGGRVELLEVKPAGGRLMPFAAFAHGRHVAPPDRLLALVDAGGG